jgi:RNA polymerase sigma-70 factor (ECF subfamily)
VGASPTTNTKFRRIYDEHFEAVTRYCLRRLPVADVNDATAEVFLVAWKKIDRMPDGAEALRWLYGVARNVVRNAARSTRRSGRLAGRLRGLAPPQPPDPSSVVVRRREDEALVTAMTELSDDDQEVLRLRAYEGLTAPEIAVALGISTEAAKKRVTRALGRLRRSAALPRPEVSPHPRAIPEGGER